jgi:hypothetical protein
LSRLPADATVIVSDTSARVPGLVDNLRRQVEQVLIEADGVAAANFVKVADLFLEAPGVTLKTALPHLGARTDHRTSPPAPTHALCGDIAEPLAILAGFEFSGQDGSVTATRVPAEARLNGAAATAPLQLAIGDELHVGDKLFRLIRVKD